VLDKKYIFCYETKNVRHDAEKMFLYLVMSVLTTLLFWGSEYSAYFLAHCIFDDTRAAENAMFIGAIFGLALGYALKYRLDKKFVFNKNEV
jgi:hypothetical protein